MNWARPWSRAASTGSWLQQRGAGVQDTGGRLAPAAGCNTAGGGRRGHRMAASTGSWLQQRVAGGIGHRRAASTGSWLEQRGAGGIGHRRGAWLQGAT